MIRIAIVEDEALAAKRLIRLLDNLDVEIEIAIKLSTVIESVEFLSNHMDEIDLLLMDIQLGDGNSFEILKQVSVSKPIIFTTAYDQYALRAFEHLSLSYLLKPIQQEDLNKAIDKYQVIYEQDDQQLFDYSSVMEFMKKQKKVPKRRFLVQVGDKMRYLKVEDIAMFYAENKACYVINADGQRFYVNYTLEKLMLELDESYFHRVSRKVILNIDSIEELVPYSKGKLLVKTTVSSGFEIFVSAENIKKLKEWMNR